MLRAAMAVTAFGPRGGAPGDVDDDATLTLLSQRPMMFQDFEVEMQDRAGALGTVVDHADGHALPPECAKMLRDIVFRTHLDVFRRELLGDPPARVEPMIVRLQPGACSPAHDRFLHIFCVCHAYRMDDQSSDLSLLVEAVATM